MPNEPTSHDVTRLLLDLQQGRDGAADQLYAVVYSELHAIAAAYMRRERSDHTLQATALVHEAFLRLVDQRSAAWQNRSHFYGIAAQAMRRILVDQARRHRALKRDGGHRVTLSDEVAETGDSSLDLVLVDEALARLATLDARQARVVEIRFFAGLSIEDTAAVLEISTATVKRDWLLAKAWLQRELASAAP